MARRTFFQVRLLRGEREAWLEAARRDGFPDVSKWLRALANDRVKHHGIGEPDGPPQARLAFVPGLGIDNKED